MKLTKLLLLLLSLMLASSETMATDYVWVSGVGNWNDPAKWMPNGIPGASDNVEISAGGPTLVSNTIINALTVLTSGNITGDFNLTVNGQLILNGFSNGGLFTGNGNLTVHGNFIWLEGTIGNATATGTVTINGLLIIEDAVGSGEHYLRTKTLICNGGVNWQGGFIGVSNGAHWIVPSGTTFIENCSTYAEIFNPYSGGGVFENQGQFIRNGSAFLGIGYSFDGSLPFTNTGTFLSNGTPIHFFGPFQNNAAGLVKGTGSITFADVVSNAGTLAPGNLIGELTLEPQTTIQNHILDIDIDGIEGPGVGHDRLNITGSFNIDSSTLQVELLAGYSPPFGTSFQIALASDTIIGTFGTLNLPPNFMVRYDSNSIYVIKNAPPVCAITNPTYGQIYYDPDVILIEALAFDANDVVVLVEFFVDGIKIGEASTAPYSTNNLVDQPMGTYTLTAKATDSLGASTISAPVEIIVRCVRQDMDYNGTVNTFDYLLFLSSYGDLCSGCPADFNLDGAVNTFDFLSLIAVFGYSCNQ